MKIELMDKNKIPYKFEYPNSIKKAVKLELVNIMPWIIMDKKIATETLIGLQSRYPTKKFIPFAFCYSNDEVACFVEGKGEEVQIVHDFASPGWEERRKYKNFWEWFKSILDDMIYQDFD